MRGGLPIGPDEMAAFKLVAAAMLMAYVEVREGSCRLRVLVQAQACKGVATGTPCQVLAVQTPSMSDNAWAKAGCHHSTCTEPFGYPCGDVVDGLQ